jgi:beta-lactamase class A
MIERRQFLIGAGGVTLLAAAPGLAAPRGEYGAGRLRGEIEALERRSGGRLGVALLDTGSGRRFAWRGDERFPLCSTFKFLLAAAIFQQADQGRLRLDRRLAVHAGDLLTNSPFSKSRAGRDAAIAELCEASIVDSDNTAANLLLPLVGGPDGLNRFARSLGDGVTRLDRGEPALGEAGAGDARDTTAPAAMVDDMERLLLGGVLGPASRQRLTGWMVACRTGTHRLRAGLPRGWRVGHKTGTGMNGTSNDIAIAWPRAGRPPLLIAAYLTGSTLDQGRRDIILAGVARVVAAAVSRPAA